ncbi:MAG: oligosaccharide biosynthesis protein Alg14 [Paludibacteraceae bacterium]|nr:oligosaccharide biosynthesis protein Alg14 [Paludibacteraceae bacterium]
MKLLAVASKGGHWIELQRITRSLEKEFEVVYCSTHSGYKEMADLNNRYYNISDFSRWNAWRILSGYVEMLKIIRSEKPDVLITTGAAPGLTALMAAKTLGIRTIWIDTIASSRRLSASGRIAMHFADRTYTQWKELSGNKKVVYAGTIFG